MAGLLMWLLGYRIMQKRWREVTLVHLTALAVIAAALTAPLETFWYHFRSNVPIDRIFFANLNFSYTIRPMWWVLAAGLAVVAHGRMDVFEAQGAVQLYVESLQPAGFGNLALAFEQTKARLAAEGLFDPSRKRPLPQRPTTIALDVVVQSIINQQLI